MTPTEYLSVLKNMLTDFENEIGHRFDNELSSRIDMVHELIRYYEVQSVVEENTDDIPEN
jgi:hypothetical protein